MILKYKITAIATICFALTGCGGGGDEETPASMTEQTTDTDTDTDTDTETESNQENIDNGNDVAASVLTGVFVDSAVEGVTYTTGTQSGVTNSAGEFNYLAGEQVTFSIGATQLPAVTAAPQVSPVEMAASTSNPTATTTNIARLLQSLDSDGNPDNGINIPTTAAATAATINFNVSVTDFENDPAVINLVANSGSTTTTLISASAANEHLNSSLGNTSDNQDQTESGVFSLDTLMGGSPWFAIRNFESSGRLECGNKYTFAANGALTVVSKSQNETQFETFNGSYSFTSDGVITLQGGDLGANVFVFRLNELTATRWTQDRADNNDAGPYLEVAFSDRNDALQYASSLGGNCETDLAQ